MKIATWNIERPRRTSDKMASIIDKLLEVDADILVLTETIDTIDLGSQYKCFHTSRPQETYFRSDERRVGVYSKFDFYEELQTFRSDTSICINLDTPLGPMAVYGTIIGTEGNTSKNFTSDLDMHIKDFESISKTNNLCICGDLNMSFSDNYYFTIEGRKKLTSFFTKNGLLNLTANIPQNIDHIVLPKSIADGSKIRLEKWNLDKRLSDHIGVAVTLNPFG